MALSTPPFTHPSSKETQSWDDPLLGYALQDPGCCVQAAHTGSQGRDVEAQQKEETHQGDLEEEVKQTKGERGWGGVGSSQQLHPVQFRHSRLLTKTMRTNHSCGSRGLQVSDWLHKI